MKKIFKFIIIALVVVSLLIVGRNFILKSALSNGIEMMTGLRLSARDFSIGIFSPSIQIKELILLNPEGFLEPVMTYVPELYIKYKLSSLIEGRLHFDTLKINLVEFNVVKNSEGKLNLDSLKISKSKSPRQAQQRNLKIDTLEFKIGRVSIHDYSKDPAGEVKEFNINIDEAYQNINDLDTLRKIIMARAITNTVISSITNLNITALEQDFAGALKSGVKLIRRTIGVVTQTTKDIVKETVGTVEAPLKNRR